MGRWCGEARLAGAAGAFSFCSAPAPATSHTQHAADTRDQHSVPYSDYGELDSDLMKVGEAVGSLNISNVTG